MTASRTPVSRAIDPRVFAIFAGWLLAVLLIGPGGDYPTTDDWAYRASVAELVQHGRLYYSDWTAANLVSHFAWGALFVKLFGLSYGALRLSTLCAAALGGAALYRLLRLAGLGPNVTGLATAVWMFNPISLALSFGFMSDVPFCALLFGALLLLAEGRRDENRLKLALGWLLGIAALLSRQLGIAIPIGWAFGCLLVEERLSVRRMALLLLPAVLFVLLQFAFQHWLRSAGIAPAFYSRQTDGIRDLVLHHPARLIRLLLTMAQKTLLYLGFLAFPLLLALAPGWVRSLGARARIVGLGISALISLVLTADLLHQHMFFPIWTNTLSYFGIGPDLDGPLTPRPVLIALTAIAVIGGGLGAVMSGQGLWRLVFRRERPIRFNAAAALVFASLTIAAATSIISMRFDRYFLPILPLALILPSLAVPQADMPRRAGLLGAAAILVAALASTLAVHDFVVTKRIQSAAYDRLAARFGHDAVDGGWVLNGPWRYKYYTATDSETPDPTFHPRLSVSSGNGAPAGYRETARLKVSRWLPWGWNATPVIIAARTTP